jgi:flagellar biosynthesis component FlhA
VKIPSLPTSTTAATAVMLTKQQAKAAKMEALKQELFNQQRQTWCQLQILKLLKFEGVTGPPQKCIV